MLHPGDMITEIITNAQGQPKPILANAISMLRHKPEWQGVLGFDEFALETMALRAPPWEAGHNAFVPRPWTTRDDVLATDLLQRWGVCVSVEVAHTAIETVAQDHAFHPVRDYLNGVTWDRRPRLTGWLENYLGAEPTPYTRAVGERFLVSAVARIMRPGCKVDTMPVLEGAQGVGKSSAVKALGEPWFSDEVADFGSKDAALQIRSAWFLEISELDALSRSETTRVKAFLSRTTDRYRPPYGRRVIEAPRQCVFVGSTNGDAYLRDETGGRRFWPVKVAKIRLDEISRDRDQLWAEAVHQFQQGSPWWLHEAALAQDASIEQAARYVGDPWTDAVQNYIRFNGVTDTCIGDILQHALEMKTERWTQAEQNRVARIFTALHWKRYQRRDGDKRSWRYRLEQ